MKVHDFKLCCCFSLPIGVCIDVNSILAYVAIGSYISHMATNYTFATVHKGKRTDAHKTCWLSMSLHMLQSGCNYLK